LEYLPTFTNDLYLAHHGILGQKWGQRNGPPYPLKGGAYTKAERSAIERDRANKKSSIYKKRHYDKMLDTDTELQTLSFDENRTKNTDVFFATYDKHDKDRYMSRFNRPKPPLVKDENGKVIGVDLHCKMNVRNALKHNVKVASEDTGADIFKELWANDRDFYNFVMDPERMYSHPYAGKRHERFKGFREANRTLEALQNGKEATEEDLETVYRLFNYAMPLSDDSMNPRMAKDVATQRVKFFNKLKENGYGAVLDVNDAMYGGLKANAPVIFFDMDALIPKEAKTTNYVDVLGATVLDRGRELLGIY